MDVGIEFAVAPAGVVGVNERLFVRLMVRLVVPVVAAGTVITTGDQAFITAPAVAEAAVVTAFGFRAAQVAVAFVASVPQL